MSDELSDAAGMSGSESEGPTRPRPVVMPVPGWPPKGPIQVHLKTSVWGRLVPTLVMVGLFVYLAESCYRFSSLAPTAGEMFGLQEEFVSGDLSADTKVAVIQAKGLLFDDDALYGMGIARFITRQVRAAEKDGDVKAVVLEIDSPGGSVTTSDEIYRKLKKLGGTKPMVAMLKSTAASGAYYIALAADEIVAAPTTVTGSIGVRMSAFDMTGLSEKVGVTEVSIQSGPMKDVLSPFRPITEEERAMLQRIVDEMHKRFVDIIEDNRKNLSRQEIESLAQGQVFGAGEAKERGLVDKIGYLDSAITAACGRIGMKPSQVKAVRYRRPSGFLSLLAAEGKGKAPIALADPAEVMKLAGPRFLYLWQTNGNELNR